MSIGNYTELQSTIANWLHRNDLGPLIPDFITLAEAKFNRKIRNEKMLATVTQALVNNEMTLPADFLEASVVSLGDQVLQFKPRQEIDQAYGNYYTIRANKLIFAQDITSPATVTLHYYQKIPALSANATNWLLTSHPDVYLYATLTEAMPYMMDDARIAIWAGAAQSAMDAVEAADEQARFSGQPLTIQTSRITTWR